MRGSPGRHGRRRLPAAARVDDADRARKAASLQATCGLWLVMWSPWHQTYTGFACFTAEPMIIDEPEVTAFLARIKQVELASSVGRAA